MNPIEVFLKNQLYLVTSEEHSLGRRDEEIVHAALVGGVRVVQLRDKGFSPLTCSPSVRAAWISKVRRLRKLTEDFHALLIINDHLAIALDEADGVHLGQNDISIDDASAARKRASRENDFIIGLSTHTVGEAMEAETTYGDLLCFYLNIGPIFPTMTKDNTAYIPLGVNGFAEIFQKVRALPVTVMGGIKARSIPDLSKVGASHFAMITEITTAQDVVSKVRSLIEITQASFATTL